MGNADEFYGRWLTKSLTISSPDKLKHSLFCKKPAKTIGLLNLRVITVLLKLY